MSNQYIRKYNDEMIQFVRENAIEFTDREIAEMMSKEYGITVTKSAISNLKKRFKIRSGENRRYFKKGYTPVNKGTKGMFGVGGNKTSFKKGAKPANWLPVGSEVMVNGYLMIKVQDHGDYHHRWKMKSRLVWEKHYGKPPEKNKKIIFLDGNPLNVTVENMRLITHGERLVMNRFGLNFDDPDLNEVGINIAKVILVTAKRKKRDKKCLNIKTIESG